MQIIIINIIIPIVISSSRDIVYFVIFLTMQFYFERNKQTKPIEIKINQMLTTK